MGDEGSVGRNRMSTTPEFLWLPLKHVFLFFFSPPYDSSGVFFLF